MVRSLFLSLLALALLSPALASAQSSALDDLFGQGAHAYFAGDYTTAYSRLTSAINAGSQDPRVFYFRGLCFMRLGREPDARRDYARGAELERINSDRSAEIGASLSRVQGSPRATLEAYRVQARMDAAQANARQRLARATPRIPPAAAVAPAAAAPAAQANEIPPPALPKADANDPFAASPAAPAAVPEKMPAKPADDPFASSPAAPAAPAAAAEKMPAKPADDPFASAPAAPATPAAAAPAAAMPAEAKPTGPLAADATVMAAARAVTDKQPQLLWGMLPAKYQEDIKGLIAEAAAKSDPEMWAKQTQVLGKLVQVAKEKKEFALAHPLLAAGPLAGAKPMIEKGWDPTVELFEILTTSELSTIDSMKTFDPEKFLAGTGQKLIDKGTQLFELFAPPSTVGPLEKLKSVKATLVSTEGTEATVQIEAPDQEPTEVKFQQVDGKWLPEQMVLSWDEQITKAKAALAAVDPATQKAQGMAMMSMVEGVLDQLLAAKDQDSFNNVVNNVMNMVSAFMPKAGGATSCSTSHVNCAIGDRGSFSTSRPLEHTQAWAGYLL